MQDPSEALIGLLVPGDGPDGPIVDLCAAPGTKASHLCERFPGRVVAADRTRGRVQRMRETLTRTASGAALLLQDALHPAIRSGSVAGVLVDAPCSNLGVLRRRMDARWNAKEREIARHGLHQERFLRSAARLIRPGGWLLYSVCSIEPEETAQVRASFLAEVTSFEAAAFAHSLPAEVIDDDGALRILPGQLDCDGVYACLFRRGGG